jgi:Xaa-Pro aminopeptidase
MVDGVYHMIYEELKPGVRENDIVALSNKMLYEMGSTTSRRSTPSPASAATRIRTTSPTAISGPATRRSSISCSPTRAIAPATTGPSTSAARRRAERRLRQGAGMDRRLDRMIKPGVTHRQGGRGLAEGRGIRLPNEDAAFGLQFGHGLGLALHERPIISRACQLDHPMEIQTGMVFALETYCPASRRLLCRADRGRGRRDRHGLRGHQPVPGRGPADRQPLLTRGKRPGAVCPPHPPRVFREPK